MASPVWALYFALALGLSGLAWNGQKKFVRKVQARLLEESRLMPGPLAESEWPMWLEQWREEAAWRKDKKNAVCLSGATCTITRFMFESVQTETLTLQWMRWFYETSSPVFPHKVQALTVAMRRRMQNKARAGGNSAVLNVVWVGVNGLPPPDIELIRTWLTAVGTGLRFAFLERSVYTVQMVKQKLQNKLGIGEFRATVVNKAFCPTTPEASRTIQGFYQAAFPVQALQYSTIASLAGKDVLIRTLRRLAVTDKWPQNFRRRTDEQLEKLIWSIPNMPHVTPSGLEEETGWAPWELDVVVMAAEGFNAELLRELTSLEGFRPAIIGLEWGFHLSERGTLPMMVEDAKWWASLGYEVFKDGTYLWIFKTIPDAK